tara:strand:- start:309995 stop:310129 length:135 start_codon:yes stop_codon:yes gene_type:complete
VLVKLSPTPQIPFVMMAKGFFLTKKLVGAKCTIGEEASIRWIKI